MHLPTTCTQRQFANALVTRWSGRADADFRCPIFSKPKGRAAADDGATARAVIPLWAAAGGAFAGSGTGPGLGRVVCPRTSDCAGVWGNWDLCTKACGGGTQARSYLITADAFGGGAPCAEAAGAQEERPCNIVACAQDCQVPLAAGHVPTRGRVIRPLRRPAG